MFTIQEIIDAAKPLVELFGARRQWKRDEVLSVVTQDGDVLVFNVVLASELRARGFSDRKLSEWIGVWAESSDGVPVLYATEDAHAHGVLYVQKGGRR